MKSRKLFGYFLMIIGTIIPLYLAANMSLNILSQEKRHQEFNASYKELSSEDYEVEYKISDDQDAIFAFIKIPSIDVSEPIYLGATDKHLISGFAHVDGTSLPVGGIGSRSVIAGHRGGYYGRLDLLNAHKINKGDILSIDLGEKKLEYKMVSREIINPADWERLKPDNNKDMITLLTCDPFPTAQNRMLVNFERVVQEVEQTPEEDIKTETQDVKVEETKTSNINTMKYLLFVASIFLSILLIVLVIKFIKILITKK